MEFEDRGREMEEVKTSEEVKYTIEMHEVKCDSR
jgi:hypothetical protein